MAAFAFPSVLAPTPDSAPLSPAAPLAVLNLAPELGPAEEQLLRLCATLRGSGQPVALVAAAGSALGEQASHQLAVPPLSSTAGLLRRLPQAAWALSRWLRQAGIGTVLVARAVDLPVASAAKWLLRGRLRLIFQQHEPLATAAPTTWWGRLSRRPLDAWLVPLPGAARAAQARTGFEARHLWVVPPALPPTAETPVVTAPAQARTLLDLPTVAPVLGVADEGHSADFALELLYRLRQELQVAAELVIVSHPGTLPTAARWQALRQQAHALGLTAVVHLRPFQVPKADGLLFPALDALLCPTPTHDYDPLLLTALAAGCPVVAAEGCLSGDFPGLRHLFPAHDLAQGAAQVQQALQAGRPAPAALLGRYFSAAQETRLLTDILHYLAA